MCAAKSSKRPARAKVARHLYRRGNSYEFFRRIPPDARHLFDGLTAKSESFGDVTRREADHMAAALRKQTDKLIAQARSQPDPTAKADARAHATHLPTNDEMDRAIRGWVLEQERRLSRVDDPATAKQNVRDMGMIAELTPAHLREGREGSLLVVSWIADALMANNGWALPDQGKERRYLLDRVGRAQREVAIRVRAELNFEDRPQATHAMFDPAAFEQDRAMPLNAPRAPVPLLEVFDRYVAEKQPKPRSVTKFRGALRLLIAHLGHDDAVKVTPDDLLRWKDALLAPDVDGRKPRRQGTVRNGYLGAIKPVFQWATNNRLIASNPVAGITVSVPRRVRTRAEKGFTEAEARVVLTAALAIDWQALGTFKAFACRWLPWLCAYSGARVGELAQLRRSDVARTSDGIWYMTITPEAGGQKGAFTRQVALHEHLLEQGFIAAIEDREGPLFYDPTRRKDGSTGNPQYVKVGDRVRRWIREDLGITDRELQPNHGWRHRFATVARRIKMDPDVRQAILGHSAQTEHQEYGDVLIHTSHEWLCEFPRYEIDTGHTDRAGQADLQPVATVAP